MPQPTRLGFFTIAGEGAARTLAERSVIGAGFALPRDAGPHRENWPEVGVPSRQRHADPGVGGPPDLTPSVRVSGTRGKSSTRVRPDQSRLRWRRAARFSSSFR